MLGLFALAQIYILNFSITQFKIYLFLKGGYCILLRALPRVVTISEITSKCPYFSCYMTHQDDTQNWSASAAFILSVSLIGYKHLTSSMYLLYI